MQAFAPALVWLLVIVLGISAGAGLYESRIMVPIWANTPPGTWINTGTAFWAFVSTGPLTLIVLVSLAAIWWFDGPARSWWLAALGIVIIERIATFTYFIPTMIWLQQHSGITPEVSSTLATWSFVNHVRHGLTIAAWLISLKALTLLSVGRGDVTSL
jgi:hypothetical protein